MIRAKREEQAKAMGVQESERALEAVRILVCQWHLSSG